MTRLRTALTGLLGSTLVAAPLALAAVPAAAAVAPRGPSSVGVAQVAGGAAHGLRLKVLGRTPDAQPLLAGTGATGYTPAQVRAMLGLTGRGAGQTIAVVTAYDAPNVAKDLATFNAHFGLPAPPSFRKVNQTGGTKLPPVNAGWALEAALDVQWAHAVAPDAAILLVEASTNALGNLLTAVSYAAKQPGVTVISGSFGAAEFSKQAAEDVRCRLAAAVCVFASGDNGNPGTYPATSPAALAVGGTSLALDAAGAVTSEVAWSGSGGGVSAYSAKPPYQSSFAAPRRTSPDVSYGADPNKGFAVYSSTPYNGQSGWFQMGGTSAGAPQWAGILAAANELRRKAGKPVLSAGTTATSTPFHSALYRSAAALRDITSGTNGTCGAPCSTAVGHDAVTGLGSPRAGVDSVLRDAY